MFNNKVKNGRSMIARIWVHIGFVSVLSFCGSSFCGTRWVRSGVTTNAPLWGIEGGLQFALHPGGFSAGDGGPRGLIRLGYPTLTNGGYDLINFIAIEPVTAKGRGYSELEKSARDNLPGKVIRAGKSGFEEVRANEWEAGEVRSIGGGVEELMVPIVLEPFDNGAHVRLRLAQRSDLPNEVRIEVEAEDDSAPIVSCILTATMGNKARARLLSLKDGPVSSLQLYPDYRREDFAPHHVFSLSELPRTTNGDVLVSILNDELNPGVVQPFGRPGFWDYRGAKVVQYWRKAAGDVVPSLQCAVNGRYTYWMSKQPIPGGVAFENFELREPFKSGQSVIFGITSPGAGQSE